MGAESAVAVMITRCECGKCQLGHAFEHSRDTSFFVKEVSWSIDGSRICSGSADHTVRVWEVSSGECIRTLKGHSGEFGVMEQ